MVVAGFLIGLATIGLSPTLSTSSAADMVTLRDGKIVLGQLVESDRRGPILMLVRHAWAEVNLPDRAAVWSKAEAPITRKAEAHRRERLLAWKRDRRQEVAGGERITAWIDSELGRLAAAQGGEVKSTLMVARLARTEVKSIERKPRRDGRMLRLGWLSNLPDVEAMSREDLTQALDGRGFSADADSPVAIDALLPVQPEADLPWLIHRAATEVVNDPGGRWLRYQGMVMPEPAAGEVPPAGASLNAALGSLKELLGETPVDPMPGKLRELGEQGRAGVVVTRLDLSPDFASVAVETTLWARGGDRWVPVIVRSSSVRSDDLPVNAGVGLAEDPQVKAAFGVVEMLGLGEVPPELKRRSLNMGAATSKALGQARGALDEELNSAALSLQASRDPQREPKR